MPINQVRLVGRSWISVTQELQEAVAELAESSFRIATIESFIDNTAGRADNVLQAIPDPADAPVSADALRDDLVANALPAIRDNVADLAAKVNAILAAFR